MDLEMATVSWKKFFVNVSGITNGAHSSLVAKFKSVGQIEVFSPEESEYILLFCPITSQVERNVSEALERIPGNKQVLLVVMHHSFNPDHVTADSRRQVNSPKVHLVVDCVFHEGRLLDCKRNDTAWSEIQTFLKIPTAQGKDENVRGKTTCNTKKIIAFLIGFVIGLTAVILATQLT